MKSKSLIFLALFFSGLYGCNNEEPQTAPQQIYGLKEKMVMTESLNLNTSNARQAAGIEAWMVTANEALAEHNLQLEKIEYYGAEQEGKTILFEDRGNKQLDSDFVPNDPRNGTGTVVPYIIDGTEQGTSSGMTAVQTTSAIINSMRAWETVTCSKGLEIPNYGTAPFDVGYVQWLLGFGGIGGYFPGMIVHAGNLPGLFFDAIAPGGGNSILGVTFTLTWINDLDGNGKGDVAIKEIYMNDNFNWQDAPDDVMFNGIFDYETVVMHEVGHGLSQGHFGKATINKKGKIKFSPAALMNAGYSVGTREIKGTDNGGHCTNWEDWPNN